MGKKGLVCGVGVNDADYPTAKEGIVDGKRVTTWRCPYYTRWCAMLRRCYSKERLQAFPTYIGCSVCEEWLTFSNFRKWMASQNWEDRHLDKDFLIEGNKVYGPDTCVFLPGQVNGFILTSKAIRGKYPLGVAYRKKSGDMVNELARPYRAIISNKAGVQISLGAYSTPRQAHRKFLEEKLNLLKLYIEDYKDDPLVSKGLERIENKIQYHLDNNLELTEF